MSNTLKQRYPRCTYTNTDGTRCARRVPPPDTVCHIHRNIQSTGFATPLTEPVEINEIEILRKLARAGEPGIRLRAVDLLLSLKKDAASAPRDESTQWLRFASADQKAALRALLDQIAAIKQATLTYIAAGGAPVAEEPPNVQHEHQEQEQPEPVATEGEPRDESNSIEALDERHAGPEPLAADRYDAAGLFIVKGVVTHALGDDHALAILEGRIPYDDAVTAHRAALSASRRMAKGILK